MARGISECMGGEDIHHITHMGAGGDDVPENLIKLCRKHHSEAHDNKLSRERLRAILSINYGYNYED